MSYAEKYKDPRWQKKRLEILERDSWTCQKCYARDKPLHVHHKVYVWGEDPWDAFDGHLITLCQECHTRESEEETGRRATQTWLTQAVCGRLLCDDVARIAGALDMVLHFAESDIRRSYFANALGWFLEDPDNVDRMVLAYTEHCKSGGAP